MDNRPTAEELDEIRRYQETFGEATNTYVSKLIAEVDALTAERDALKKERDQLEQDLMDYADQ